MAAPKPKVLVVDDDEANLRTFVRVFRAEFEVAVAARAQEGLAFVERERFDVAFVDFAMPQMNGVEFLRRASQLQPDMGRVMLTAHADLPEVQQTLASGLSATVIMKPWEREDIVRWVDNLAKMAAMRRAVASMASTVVRGPK